MKKNISVAIITLYHNNNNYGAMLQTYALFNAIEKYNCICNVLKIQNRETMSISKKIQNELKSRGLSSVLRKIVKKCTIIPKKVIILLVEKTIKNNILRRIEKFIEFREEKINHSDIIYNKNNITTTINDYDIFICGSDQIWNPQFHWWNAKIYWLGFVPSTKIKISYAASIGVNTFTEDQEQEIKKYLSDFCAISVREKEAKELLGNIIDNTKEIHWTLDPTLLLSRNEWDKLCSERRINEKYIFAYILGENIFQRKFVKKYAKSKGLKIVTLPYIHSKFRVCDLTFGDIKLYDVSPEDFISLIKYAEYVYTDSFHGAVFSGIYHKDFFVFKRHKDKDKNSMNSRIYSLMDLFCANDRIIDEKSNIGIINDIKSIDYELLNKNIAVKRKYSLDFLENILNLNIKNNNDLGEKN